MDYWSVVNVLWKSSYAVTLQLHCFEKNGKQITKMVSYCAYHRYSVAPSFSFKYNIFYTYVALFLTFLSSSSFVISMLVQGSKSWYSFDYSDSFRCLFCQKPYSETKEGWFKADFFQQSKVWGSFPSRTYRDWASLGSKVPTIYKIKQ